MKKNMTMVITDQELTAVRDALIGQQVALEIFERVVKHASDLQKLLDSFGQPMMPHVG